MKKQLREIYLFCKSNNLLEMKLSFSCFADGMISYGNSKIEITIISDDSFLPQHTIDELLRLKRIEYFEFSSKKYKNTYNFLAENNPN